MANVAYPNELSLCGQQKSKVGFVDHEWGLSADGDKSRDERRAFANASAVHIRERAVRHNYVQVCERSDRASIVQAAGMAQLKADSSLPYLCGEEGGHSGGEVVHGQSHSHKQAQVPEHAVRNELLLAHAAGQAASLGLGSGCRLDADYGGTARIVGAYHDVSIAAEKSKGVGDHQEAEQG